MSFINDTIAFLVGKTFKGPLIIPSISPKKTWSGTISSFLVSLFLLLLYDFNLFFSILVSLSFFIGDVFFSYFKRIKKSKIFLIYYMNMVVYWIDLIVFFFQYFF